ncbi:MAG: hypothetical protein AB7Q27_12285, partial [Acidimicrobiia bacterium]
VITSCGAPNSFQDNSREPGRVASTAAADRPTPTQSSPVVELAPASTSGAPPGKKLEEVYDALQGRVAETPMAFRSISLLADRVEVELAPSSMDLAKDLVREYDPLVVVRLGRYAYPLNAASQLSAPAKECSPVAPGGPSSPSLMSETIVDAVEVRSGETMMSHLLLTNNSAEAIVLEGHQPLLGVLVGVNSNTALAEYAGPIAETGFIAELQPGESTKVELLVGTDSCDEDAGYSAPPGRYEIRLAYDPLDFLASRGISPAPVEVVVT